MRCMTEISTEAAHARETARTTTGQFGAQEHTAPDDILNVPTPPEETTYGVYSGDSLVSAGAKGAGMTDALHRARTYASGLRPKTGESLPAIAIRAEGSDISVTLPFEGEGRIVGWTSHGDAVTAEEMDNKGVSLTQLEGAKVEPFIDLGPYDEGELPRLEQWARDSDYEISTVYVTRDDVTGGRNIDIGINTNLTWDAEGQFPDEDFDDDSDLDPDDDRSPAEQRYERWLDENEETVKEVYLEWFNADIDVPDTWEAATVTLRKTVPYERFTDSLVIEDVYPTLAEFSNRTDPGTFGSPYVMTEIRRRVEQRQEEAERQAELEQRGLLARR